MRALQTPLAGHMRPHGSRVGTTVIGLTGIKEVAEVKFQIHSDQCLFIRFCMPEKKAS